MYLENCAFGRSTHLENKMNLRKDRIASVVFSVPLSRVKTRREKENATDSIDGFSSPSFGRTAHEEGMITNLISPFFLTLIMVADEVDYYEESPPTATMIRIFAPVQRTTE